MRYYVYDWMEEDRNFARWRSSDYTDYYENLERSKESEDSDSDD